MTGNKKWLEKHAPLGMDLTSEIGMYILGVIVATGQSLLFLLSYSGAYQELYEYRGGKKVLIEGAFIQPFDNLAEGLFTFGIIVCVVSLLTVIYHYIYHYQGSKMMYLMKRLPDKTDLKKRCWTLPVAGAVIMAVWMFILRMIFYAVYMLCTPSQCLPL